MYKRGTRLGDIKPTSFCAARGNSHTAIQGAPELKIVLISPKGPSTDTGGIFQKSLRYQPLTLTTLAALIPPELKPELTLIDEGMMSIPDSLDADIVAMTVITGTAKRAYELADRYRAAGMTVVLGGPRNARTP